MNLHIEFKFQPPLRIARLKLPVANTTILFGPDECQMKLITQFHLPTNMVQI